MTSPAIYKDIILNVHFNHELYDFSTNELSYTAEMPDGKYTSVLAKDLLFLDTYMNIRNEERLKYVPPYVFVEKLERRKK